MRDILAKISMMPLSFNRNAWRWWIDDVLNVDLDQQECCNGHMCGCRGTTFRERHAYYNPVFRFLSK